jgi:hypothetical protein
MRPSWRSARVVLVDARLVVEALLVALRDQPDQVLVAAEALREEDEVMVGLLLTRDRHALAPVPERDVGFDADDRTDPLLERLLVELDRPEEVSVVGDGDGLHPHRGRLVDHGVDLLGAVEKRELSVIVEMNERRSHAA